MAILDHDNLIKEISILGKDAQLSLSRRQAIRDRLFKKIGQANLIDAVQTQTEVGDLVMPLTQLQRLFSPKRIVFSLPATIGVVASVFVATFATGAMAQSARPGDPLFGVRKAVETVQIALASNPAAKAELKLSIVNDRIKALETADGSNIQAILNESKKALASAQASISALPTDKTGTDLNTKLKTLIESQKTTLSTIAKDNVSSDEVKKTVLAMRDALDKLITPADSKTDIKPDTSAVSNIIVPEDLSTRTNFYGSLTTSYGTPALFENGRAYVLAGVDVDLMSYIGSQNIAIIGQLNGKTLTVFKLTIDNKLIWENMPDKDDNNLSRVEGDQNTSPR